MRRTALAAVCLAAAVTAGLTGCGTQDKEPDRAKEPFAGLTGGQIAERALEATTGAESLRMKGDIRDDETGGTLRIDMALNKKGECAGTMGMGDEGTAELIKTGDSIYMKYDEAFLRAQSEGEPKGEVDATVAMLAGKWTKMSLKGADADDVAAFCDLGVVLGDAEDGSSEAERGKTTTIDGKRAITLTEQDGKDAYTFYVATEGKPYLLRLDNTSPEDPGSITFSRFDEPVPARKPSGQVLDLDALG
ncbi:hypothetical protein [Streptomyces sp. NPDC029526]|uniref:hypothetical protein n=1 Tax=Streptomyces sp. NPDC029526 TaxID=3155728 RepID=UPI0033E0C3DA